MKRVIVLMMLITTQAFSSVFTHDEVERLKTNFLANIQSSGAIIASPSDTNPNYYFDWVRDSAIAMQLIEYWYEAGDFAGEKNIYKNYLTQYVSWTEKIQHQSDSLPGQDILGEPKFYLHGQPFDGPWGRPQNDGPALRALVMTRFANQLLAQQEDLDYVKRHLYNPSMDPLTMGIIKMDLEYIAHHWQEANFDLWEEVYGHHFFTAMAQQKALISGAALARRLGDEAAADFYSQQAQLMEKRLYQHVDFNNRVIQATLAPHPGPQKILELDSSVILAALIHPHKEGALALHNEVVKNTINELHKQFNDMFPINNNNPGAILFGRYPGDTYNGHTTNSLGNPWFILTATMAEYYYTLAANLEPTKDRKQIVVYINEGDNYLKLIKKYAPDMILNEQINLYTGAQQGAVSLTWSYVSLLRAIELRARLS